MKKYIDVEATLNNLPDDLPYKASVKRVLIQAPSEDVEPIEDVNRLKHILNCYSIQYGTVVDREVAEVRHGTWYHGTENGAVYAKCSACGRKMNYSCYGYAYCSLCGAKMDGERRSEDGRS